ncbi:MAG: 6-phosphogluconolactonase [Candidatus Levybacteria bacterium]|nr:6-phosphogluconolactonase [Candidatus Levybacteria bacterium]
MDEQFDLKNLLSPDERKKDGISLISARTKPEGLREAKKLLYRYSSRKSALFLSGGLTPRPLYEDLAKEKKLILGSAALVDERYGEVLNKESNEKMMRDSGLLSYFDSINAPFYGVLHNNSMEKEAKDYEETVRYLLSYFPHNIGVLGVGKDGHIGGIPAIPEISEKIIDEKRAYVSFYSEWQKGYNERITMNFMSLSLLDLIIVLVLGKEKKDALKKMFEDPSADSGQVDLIAEVPARFLRKPEIAKKTILITDQRI